MFGYIPLLFIQFRIRFGFYWYNVTRIYVLVLSNLERLVFISSILESFGSILVHSFVTTISLYLSVVIPMSYPPGFYVPVSQSSFVISMKQLKFQLGPDKRYLNICWKWTSLHSPLPMMKLYLEEMSSRRSFKIFPNLARFYSSISYCMFETPILVVWLMLLNKG